MKKKYWLKINKFNKKIITTAIESGVEVFLTNEKIQDQIKELAVIKTACINGDLRQGKDYEEITITKKQDEDKVVSYNGKIPVIIENNDWTIIPLENLISKTSNLIQSVSNYEQAKLALTVLEKGADGICLQSEDINEIINIGKLIYTTGSEKFNLVEIEIIEIVQLTIGYRACIDTASILQPGEGLLVGDSSSGMFLVYNENVLSPYCDPRPFRINAGAIHAYVRCPDNKTKYLGELKSGDEVLIVNPKGETQIVIVGRNKIEKRPLMLVKGKFENKEYSLIMQNAETIRLTNIKGEPISITKLKKGDKVLGYGELQARHFGIKIDETISEK